MKGKKENRFLFWCCSIIDGPLVCSNDPSEEKKAHPVKTVENCLVNVIVEYEVFSAIVKMRNYFRYK